MTTKELLDSYYQGFAQKEGWESVLSDDFKFVGGDMTQTTPVVGKSAYIEVIKRFSQMFRLYLFRLLVLLALVQFASPDSFSQTSQKGSSAEFIYHLKLIFLRVRVNEHDGLLFLLDTGASASAIDLKTSERLKLPLTGTDKVEGTAGIIDVKKAWIKSIAVGKARAKDLRIPAYDLSGILVPQGMRLDGILGYDFLRFFSVHVDFSNRAITFSSKVAGYPVSVALTVPVPFTLDNGIPRLGAVLNDRVVADFRLDTGASLFETSDIYLNVTEEVWKRLTAFDSDLKPERYFIGSGVGGEIKLPVARIKKFSVGTMIFPSPFIIVQPKLGYFGKSDAIGFISNNFLEKFNPVTISYLENKLYLNRN